MKRPRPAALVLLLLALFFWRMGCGFTQSFMDDTAALKLAKPLAAAEYEKMVRAEMRAAHPAPFVLWTQRDAQTVQTPMGREAKAAVIFVRGDTRLLFPAALAIDDLAGVLVDRQTAQTLFGEMDVVGATLDCLGRGRTVRGVLNIPLPTVIVQVPPEDAAPLDYVTIADAAKRDSFVMRHGLTVSLVLERATWRALAESASLLPAALGAMQVLSALASAGCRYRRYPARRMAALFGLLAVFTGCVLGLLTVLPVRWTPPRWSDFDFWSGALPVWKRDALEWLSAQKCRPDLLAMAAAGKSALYGLLACAALAAARPFWTNKTPSGSD